MKYLDIPKVSFGIIVLNGEPFTRYCLRALYPFAHEIIVVEGACEAAAAIATPDGHSIDETLEVLYRFKAEDDPDNKIHIFLRDGFWSEKDEQSQAYAERATGDYLWQVDIDEFYKPEDMQAILNWLGKNPQITAVSFKQIAFWGGFDYVVDSWYLRRGVNIFHRIFKWKPDYQYVTHRPPTIKDDRGQNLRDLKWVDGNELAKQGILLYHYSLLFPKQVIEKCEYYGSAAWAKRHQAQKWAQEVFLELRHPYRIHNVYDYPGWLERFVGTHPPQIEALRTDIKAGRLNVHMRPIADIECLLKSPTYWLGREMLKFWEPWDLQLKPWKNRFSRLLRDPVGSASSLRRKAAIFFKKNAP
jgi:glycosyltransferase involved in cell wall biosynthesis